jgi:hypothetical protein
MAALTANRLDFAPEVWDQKTMPLAAGQHAFAGAIACIDTATGTVKKGATSTTLLAIGFFAEEVDNSGGGASVPVNVDFFRPIRGRWITNDTAGGAVAAANVGSYCYVKDDQTVTITSTGASKAGRVWAVGVIDGVSSVFVEPLFSA